MQLRQFSHKLGIRERSTLKESDHSILKKYRLIRAAWKFEVVFGDIFVLFLYKIENPLFFTFTKDSRFYNWKARKYLQKPLQIFTRHELIESFFEAPNLIPSTEITSGSIVYGKIAQTALASDLEHFSGLRIFLLSKISDLCSHLSLGASCTAACYHCSLN